MKGLNLIKRTHRYTLFTIFTTTTRCVQANFLTLLPLVSSTSNTFACALVTISVNITAWVAAIGEVLGIALTNANFEGSVAI